MEVVGFPGLLEDGFDIDLEVHAVPDEEAADPDRLIPGESDRFPMEGSFGREPSPLVTPGVPGPPSGFHVEFQLVTGTKGTQLAYDPESLGAGLLADLAFKGHFREVRGIQEVGGLQVGIALGEPGLNAGRIDEDADGGVTKLPVLRDQRSGPAGEGPSNPGQHHVPDGEVDPRVPAVDFPSLKCHRPRSLALDSRSPAGRFREARLGPNNKIIKIN